jgi:hypothetical protein
MNAVAALSLLAAGCGGSKASPSVANLGTTTVRTTKGTGGGSGGEAGGPAVAFAACIRHHGDPSLPPSEPGNPIPASDPNASAFLRAERICAAIMPQNAPPQPHRENTGPLLAFVTCMHKHGFPGLPDPDNKGRFPIDAFSGLNPLSPQFQSAVKTCQPLLHGESIGLPRVSQNGRVSIPGP